MVTAALIALLAQALPCSPVSDASTIQECVREQDGVYRVERAALKQLAFARGLAVVWVDGHFLYVDRQGATAVVLPYDNGPDPFVQGLARTLRAGRVGFVDRKLREVVAPAWDFAEPFADGLAAVCTGCRSVPDGEHRRIEGGLWGYVDRKGRSALAATHRREDLPTAKELRRRR